MSYGGYSMPKHKNYIFYMILCCLVCVSSIAIIIYISNCGSYSKTKSHDSIHSYNIIKDKNNVNTNNIFKSQSSNAEIVSSSSQNKETNISQKREKFSTMEEDIAATILESKKQKDELLQPYEDISNIPKIYLRIGYEEKASDAKNDVAKIMERFLELEKINGIVTHTHSNGDKNSVDIHDDHGIVIGKLVYLSNDWVNQILEWKDGKINGIMAFYSKNEITPYKIYNFKDNKLDGPFFEFERKGENKGTLVQYVEFKDNNYYGLCLGWTSDGIPLKGCRIITEPKLKTGLP